MKPGISTETCQKVLPQCPVSGLPYPGRLHHEPRAARPRVVRTAQAPHPKEYTHPSSSRSLPSRTTPERGRNPSMRPCQSRNKPPAPLRLPSVRVGPTWLRSCTPTPDTATHCWPPDARWRLHWLGADRLSRGQISSSAAPGTVQPARRRADSRRPPRPPALPTRRSPRSTMWH